MALEKQASSGMPLKQKVMMGAVVVIFLIVIWQVVGLMGGIGGGSAPTPATKPVANQNAKSNGMAPASAMSMSTSSAGNAQATGSQMELKQAQVMSDPRFMQQQQENEQKYIGKINDLEDLRLQRAIAETNQAIAAAKLATVTAEKNISDLLTKPAAPEVPAGTYATKLENPTAQGGGSEESSASSAQVEYTVISVSMQLGKWSAVMGSQGKLYNVIVGDVLTPDDSVVVSINKNGVVLRKNGKSRKVSIMSAI